MKLTSKCFVNSAVFLLLSVYSSDAQWERYYPDDLKLFVGDYKGQSTLQNGEQEPLVASVIPIQGNRYQIRFASGFGIDDENYGFVEGVLLDGKTSVQMGPGIAEETPEVLQIVEGGVLLSATVWSGLINELSMTGKFEGKRFGQFELNPIGFSRFEQANLGLKPSEDALVLFDGGSLENWTWNDDRFDFWGIVDGTLQPQMKGPSILTKAEFGDIRLHLEFRTPYMPSYYGQRRGNSGIYLQGRYEVQVLDSYGLTGEWNECGGIYRVARPVVHVCAPPTHWQSYDIWFLAPRFDASGQKTENARITVVHNGITIHDDLELPGPTGGGISDDEVAVGPLRLQNHAGDPVQYRNIWIKNL